MEAGAKLKTARDIVGKCESELVASETEVTRLDNELKLRTVEANAAAEVYKPIRQHFFELKKTASRLEELYKADKESDRYKDDAIAARKAVDDYKSTHDEALEAKQKADKLCQDARTKLNAANRDASRTRQALTDAQKALATERSAFVTSTKALRHEEEAKDKVRSDKLLKAKQAAAAAAEAATAANDAWYDLDTERTALESSIAALDAAQRDDAIPGVETEAKDALEALKKAISVLAGKPNPTAGDINLVLSSATDAQRACDSATKDRSLDRFSEAHAMASVVAERRVAHKNATAVSGAIAWDAAELRDKRVK
jgi:chromosome segregation ATPase